jgi:hypothetical protein
VHSRQDRLDKGPIYSAMKITHRILVHVNVRGATARFLSRTGQLDLPT